jgi:site-specific DNA-cytosine methylase
MRTGIQEENYRLFKKLFNALTDLAIARGWEPSDFDLEATCEVFADNVATHRGESKVLLECSATYLYTPSLLSGWFTWSEYPPPVSHKGMGWLQLMTQLFQFVPIGSVVLVAFEESGTVRDAMRAVGINAISADLLPTRSNEHLHLQRDVFALLGFNEFLGVIAFPPCTYLTVSGNRWFNEEKYGEKARERKRLRESAIADFMKISEAHADFIAIENPVGVMSTAWRKPDQIVHPYHFGDPHEKRTCLWLKGLPTLEHTNVVEPPPRVDIGNGKTMPAWYNEAWYGSKKERAKLRSKTFQGIADAMAEQWKKFLI